MRQPTLALRGIHLWAATLTTSPLPVASHPCQLYVGPNQLRIGRTNITGPGCTILPLTSSGQIDQTKYPFKTVTCESIATHLDTPPIFPSNFSPSDLDLLPEAVGQLTTEMENNEIPRAFGGKRKKTRRKKRKKTRRRKSRRKHKTRM